MTDRRTVLTLSVVLLVLILAFSGALVFYQLQPPTQLGGTDPAPSTTPTHSSTQPPATPPTESTQPTEPTTAPTEPPTTPTQPPTVPTEPPVEPTVPPLPETTPMRVVTNVPVHTAPDAATATPQTLPLGQQVELIATEGDWSSILLEGTVCYVPAATLRQPDHYLIVLDAGHQRHGNYKQEPNGPGSDVLKFQVSSGTQGSFTKQPEYILNLAVAQKLQAILEARGYEVVMVRNSHDVQLSNAQRAQMANGLYADAFIRIHANGSLDPEMQGMETICQTAGNPYNGDLHDLSRALSVCVLDEMAAATGAVRRFVWETDTMTGINWSRVPVTILEMGYMTNRQEDELLATEDYQQKIALGIANGIDRFFQ